MVAAHNRDLLAAQAVGLMTAPGRARTTDLRAEAAYDVVVTDFVDLARALA